MKNLRVITDTVYAVRDNLDTDQILPAEFLKINPATPEGYQELGSLAMCGLPNTYPSFIDAQSGKAIHSIIVAGDNFGCGSSREHAPIALGASGVQVIIAQSFARIFWRNCLVTGAVLAVEVPETLCDILQTGDSIEIFPDEHLIRIPKTTQEIQIKSLDVLVEIVEAEGLFPYARKIGKI
ncbi:3-isopropylmalate dehydratase [Merismopedia glauca]|uniref:3-isopropylmalate dehydratase n=1 Tax=Merismopedia glauca CCAP 1448/3 TaxID=1296344 RepID=A0A2T1C1V1_9CYAN|nr:3-isopropylmalate dehydratase [Merismopedia glauca]PSB02093.1 3-isopropylmalate dehydratase [Merismopedia glauca CCAP 1448/3]